MGDSKKQHVFLIGAKSFGSYGGYETFIDKLTEYHQNNNKIKYHVACKSNGNGCMDFEDVKGITHISKNEFIYHNADCYKIHVPERMGAAQAIIYDVLALRECCKIIKNKNIDKPIVYIMACRIGPFIKYFYKKIHKLNGKIYLNPDGHEWMRSKWSKVVRKYWKISEKMMVKWSDLDVCDSKAIEKYIHDSYNGKGINGKNPKTTYIAYGADLTPSKLFDEDEKLIKWYEDNHINKHEYYLVVGRFVPENSFETVIREFMKSNTEKDLVLITNLNEKYLDYLEKKLHFKKDKRIKFVGALYNQELLKKIRENAYAYLHGHTVGGTNPSLIEALAYTNLNLLVDVEFNKEVAKSSAFYWNQNEGNLSNLIGRVESLKSTYINELGRKAKKRVEDSFTWEFITREYEKLFLEDDLEKYEE